MCVLLVASVRNVDLPSLGVALPWLGVALPCVGARWATSGGCTCCAPALGWSGCWCPASAWVASLSARSPSPGAAPTSPSSTFAPPLSASWVPTLVALRHASTFGIH